MVDHGDSAFHDFVNNNLDLNWNGEDAPAPSADEQMQQRVYQRVYRSLTRLVPDRRFDFWAHRLDEAELIIRDALRQQLTASLSTWGFDLKPSEWHQIVSFIVSIAWLVRDDFENPSDDDEQGSGGLRVPQDF